MPALPQLIDADRYQPCEWDLKADRRWLDYWVGVFVNHAESLMRSIAASYPDLAPQRLAELRERYVATMRRFGECPEHFERIDILTLDAARDELLRSCGVLDPFAAEKRRANQAALALLPKWFSEIDQAPASRRLELVCQGLLAGNMFDLGAAAAAACYQQAGADFERIRSALPPRPWLVDDVDRWAERWRDGGGYEHVAIFVDNAGPDFCLGCLGLARWCALRGARVTLAANERPALNDVTVREAADLLEQAGRADETLGRLVRERRVEVISTGNHTPLIDLAHLAPDCVAHLADADLLVLVGMGRALESNYRARLACDAVRVAVLKDRMVARWLGGRLFDCILGLGPGV